MQDTWTISYHLIMACYIVNYFIYHLQWRKPSLAYFGVRLSPIQVEFQFSIIWLIFSWNCYFKVSKKQIQIFGGSQLIIETKFENRTTYSIQWWHSSSFDQKQECHPQPPQKPSLGSQICPGHSCLFGVNTNYCILTR